VITLSATNHSIDVTMTAITTNSVEYTVAYVDVTTTTFAPAGATAALAGPGPTTLISAPAASTQRQVKYISIFNADTATNTQTIQFNVGGTRRTLFKVTLLTGEQALYINDVGWSVFSATGSRKVTLGDVIGPGSSTDNAIARFDGTTGKLIQNSGVTIDDSGNVVLAANATVDGVDISNANLFPPQSQRVLMSPLNRSGAAKLLVTNTGYFVYVGRVRQAITVARVEFHVTTIGAGAQTAEVGLFSTTNAPNKTAQSLTKIVATSTVDSLITTGVKRNTSSFAQAVAAGTHLWAGIRTAMATTQPTIEGLNFDMAQGQIMTATAPGALTGAGPFTGVLLAASLHGATSDVPDLRVTLD
jgi:hypothetical protein